jgi:hypothetical protein
VLDRTTCTRGLQLIADQIGQELTEQKFNAYYLGLANESDPREWAAFCCVAAKENRWRFLPSVPELIDALRVYRGGASADELEDEAATAYARVTACAEYSPEVGAVWTYRAVAERCGKAAADAFVIAGGHEAFATNWESSKRREKFLNAYRRHARDVPASRLLPECAAALAALPAAPDAPVTRTEAEEAIAKIRAIVGADKAGAPAIDRARMTANEREARLALLRAQAALEVPLVEVEAATVDAAQDQTQPRN